MKGVLDFLFGRQRLDRVSGLSLAEKRGLVSRQPGALEELGRNLAIELADGPAAPQGLCFLEVAGLAVVDGEEPDVMRPRQEKRGRPSQASGFRRRRLRILRCIPGLARFDRFRRHCLRN